MSQSVSEFSKGALLLESGHLAPALPHHRHIISLLFHLQWQWPTYQDVLSANFTLQFGPVLKSSYFLIPARSQGHSHKWNTVASQGV